MPNRPRLVFISYARADARMVHALVEMIEAAGLPCFLDTRNIRAGQRWSKAIGDAMVAADGVVVFLGSAELERWRESEAHRAVRGAIERGVPCVPFLLPGFPDGAAPPEPLDDFQAVDLRHVTDAIAAVVAGLTAAAARPKPAPKPRPARR